MAGIGIVDRPVFLAKTKNRCYLTRIAAAHAEARALLDRKYPAERSESDEMGRITYGGWHWSADERLKRVHIRLVKIILRQFKQHQAIKADQTKDTK